MTAMARTIMVEFHDGTKSLIHHVERIDDSDYYSVKFYDRDIELIEQLSKADIKHLLPIESEEKTTSLSPLTSA
jgi:hypothetical protein